MTRESYIEHAPFVACGAAACWIRAADLGRTPLSVSEATAAWAAWSTAGGAPSVMPLLDPPPVSAALFGAQHALFWMAGAGDATARLAPAVIGALVIVVSWALRHHLGRTTALALSVLLACDPLLVAHARMADGAALTSTACWAILAAVLVARDGWSRLRPARWTGVLAMAMAAAMISGPLAWDFLPVLIVGGATLHWRRDTGDARVGTWVALAGAAALALTTAAFTEAAGPSLVSAGVGHWLRQWSWPSGLSLAGLWVTVLRYEILPIALGLGGLLVAWSRRESSWLLAWLLWGVALTLRPGRAMDGWLVMAPPLLLSGARAVAWLAASLPASTTPLMAASTRVAIVALGLLLAQFVHGTFEVIRADRQAWHATDGHVEPGVRLLAGDVAAWQRRDGPGQPRVIEVTTRGAPDPVLGWYLRDHQPVRWVAVPSTRTGPGPTLIIEPAVDETGDGLVYAVRHGEGAGARVRVR